MTEPTIPYEQDEAWLYEQAAKIGKYPPDNVVDAFCERVWDAVHHGVDVPTARLQAFRRIYG